MASPGLRRSWSGSPEASETPIVPDPYQLGRVSYSQGNYKGAIPFLTRAINEGSISLIAAIETRAAAYTKLGNYEAALRDVHQMLKQDKSNVKGYLSGMHILTLKGDHNTAKGLYEKALKRFPFTDSNHSRLTVLYAKLALGKDPLPSLPLELIELIFNKLGFPDVCRCIAVSKSWQHLLTTLPRLWTNLDFMTAQSTVKLDSIRKYIKRGSGLPTRVTLDRFGKFTGDSPYLIATRCQVLYELVILGGLVGTTMLQAAPHATNLKTLSVGGNTHITCDTVDQLLANCKALERADFLNILPSFHQPGEWNTDLPNLQSLTMGIAKMQTPRTHALMLGKLVKRISNVRKLVIRGDCAPVVSAGVTGPDFSSLKQLEILNISGMFMTQAPIFPSSLHRLDISKIRSPMLQISSSKLPKLTRLSLASAHDDYVHHNEPHYYKAMLEGNKGKLTHLDATARLSGKELEELIISGFFQSIVELRLGMCNVDDNQATLLATHAPKLRILHLERSNITGVGVKALVTALKGQLEFLNLDECRKCAEDAITWATSMGIKISRKCPPENIRRGSRLRFG